MTYEEWKHKNWEMLCDSFEQRLAENYAPRERVMLAMDGRLDTRFEQHALQEWSRQQVT